MRRAKNTCNIVGAPVILCRLSVHSRRHCLQQLRYSTVNNSPINRILVLRCTLRNSICATAAVWRNYHQLIAHSLHWLHEPSALYKVDVTIRYVVRFEVCTAVLLKIQVFWNVTLWFPTYFRNVGSHLPIGTASHARKHESLTLHNLYDFPYFLSDTGHRQFVFTHKFYGCRYRRRRRCCCCCCCFNIIALVVHSKT